MSGQYQVKFKLLDLTTEPATPIQVGVQNGLLDENQFISTTIVTIQKDHS